jgi:hypothetical protein
LEDARPNKTELFLLLPPPPLHSFLPFLTFCCCSSLSGTIHVSLWKIRGQGPRRYSHTVDALLPVLNLDAWVPVPEKKSVQKLRNSGYFDLYRVCGNSCTQQKLRNSDVFKITPC